jgi:hypothetical protein
MDPLAVVPIALGAACDLLHLLRINQEDSDAAALQERKERNPIDAGGFERDGGNPTGREPVGEGVEVSGAGADAAYRLWVITGRDGDPVAFSTDVDACRVQINGGKLWGESGCGPGSFLLASRHGCLHNVTR